MQLLYDLLPTQSKLGDRYHGGSEYTKTLFEYMFASQRNSSIEAIYNPDHKFDPEFSRFINERAVTLIPVKSQHDLQALITTHTYQKFYSALPSIWDIDFEQTEFIFTLHGLRALEMPTDAYEVKFLKGVSKLKALTKKVFLKYYVESRHRKLNALFTKRSKKTTIITVSNHSKYSLLNFYPHLDVNQIQIYYSPPTTIQRIGSHPPNISETVRKYNLRERGFFLIVSAGVWRKNAYRAVTALDRLYSLHEMEFDTVVLGNVDNSVFSVENKHRFTFMSYISVDELSAFYAWAYCLIYPSLNEGFGYPPLESMTFGTPVISSFATSLPEVCGQAALYFNPFSIEELQTRILYLTHDTSAWTLYSERGKTHAQQMLAKQSAALTDLCDMILE